MLQTKGETGETLGKCNVATARKASAREAERKRGNKESPMTMASHRSCGNERRPNPRRFRPAVQPANQPTNQPVRIRPNPALSHRLGLTFLETEPTAERTAAQTVEKETHDAVSHIGPTGRGLFR